MLNTYVDSVRLERHNLDEEGEIKASSIGKVFPINHGIRKVKIEKEKVFLDIADLLESELDEILF